MRAIRFSERASFRFSSEVLTVHESYADMLRGLTRTKVTTVMNCPDDKLFRPRVFREWSPAGEVVFGYHGLIAPRHGLVQVVEALAKVRADVPGAQLRLWGSGDGVQPVRDRVEALGLGDAVRLPDHLVPIDQMTAELDQVHIGVLASQLDPWTRHVLPNKLMEYAVMGIPVITFRNPVIERYFPRRRGDLRRPGHAGEPAQGDARPDPRPGPGPGPGGRGPAGHGRPDLAAPAGALLRRDRPDGGPAAWPS